MKTIILLIALLFAYQIVEARPHPKKQRHQNKIFQRHLQSRKDNSFVMNQSFKPRGQFFLPKIW